MTQEEEARRNRLASAYSAMMQSEAWKDLENFANGERESSMKRMDTKNASDLVLGEVCEERGIRKGIFKVIQHAEFRAGGH
jgi:flagellar motility protein MotE (MotC chaperone)